MDFACRSIREPNADLLDMMATIGSQIGQFIERKRAEAALLELQRDLAHANRVTAMGQLTASISHEVAQPIAASMTNANAALRWLEAKPPDLAEAQAAL